MKLSGMVQIAGLAGMAAIVLLLTSHPAFAQPFPFWAHWHHFHGGHGGHASPAPLLAAGIPAFAALGGGAAVTGLVRRFRRGK